MKYTPLPGLGGGISLLKTGEVGCHWASYHFQSGTGDFTAGGFPGVSSLGMGGDYHCRGMGRVSCHYWSMVWQGQSLPGQGGGCHFLGQGWGFHCLGGGM